MILLVDIGNTRIKWGLFNRGDAINSVNATLTSDIDQLDLLAAAQKAQRILVSNVAGEDIAQQLQQTLAPAAKPITFVKTRAKVAGLLNGYDDYACLGVDRWLALIAVAHTYQQSCIVVNAGTAITIDALLANDDNGAKFLGGTIMPGMHLLQASLANHTAQLQVLGGGYSHFPTTTEDAIVTGCLNAALGAIQLQWQTLYDKTKIPPKLVLSGGDAEQLAKNIQVDLAKHTVIVDNLVLRGLMHLESEVA